MELDFSRPGKPTDNAMIEAFNARLRAECLNESWFLSLEDAREKIEGGAGTAGHEGDWSRLTDRELARVIELAKDNIVEEPASDHNLRLWLRAVRTENALSVNSVAEQLSYKRLQNPSVDT